MAWYDFVKKLSSSNKSAPKSSPNPLAQPFNPNSSYGSVGGLQYNAGGDFIGVPSNQQYDAGAYAAQNALTPSTRPTNNPGTYNSSPLAPPPIEPDTSGLQNDISSRISNIQSVYDQLTGNIDKIVNERAQQYGQNYDQQLNNLNQGYQTNAGQQAGAYGARGLGDSSFYGAAQQQAGDIYNQNLGNIMQDRSNTLGQLGQYAQSAKAQYGAGRNAYNDVLGQLGQFSGDQLQGLNSTLGSNLSNVNAQAAGIGTNADFLGALNKITPTQNQGTSQLASKLQQLVTSGAPQFAKSQIAQGLIKQAQLTDPGAVSYWNDYYRQLLGA